MIEGIFKDKFRCDSKILRDYYRIVNAKARILAKLKRKEESVDLIEDLIEKDPEIALY